MVNRVGCLPNRFHWLRKGRAGASFKEFSLMSSSPSVWKHGSPFSSNTLAYYFLIQEVLFELAVTGDKN